MPAPVPAPTPTPTVEAEAPASATSAPDSGSPGELADDMPLLLSTRTFWITLPLRSHIETPSPQHRSNPGFPPKESGPTGGYVSIRCPGAFLRVGGGRPEVQSIGISHLGILIGSNKKHICCLLLHMKSFCSRAVVVLLETGSSTPFP